MAKRKLQRFAEIKTFPNVIHHPRQGPDIADLSLKGRWGTEYFKNDHPVIAELGCGKGEYTVGLATRFPEKNFIGLDLKGNRIWRGAKTAFDAGMKNVAFVRTRIDNIESIFAPGEVSEIWITFPDPQPQKPRERKRLTSPVFLNRYRNVLKVGGIVNLKTDNAGFYEYTLEVIKELGLTLLDSSPDLYINPSERPEYLTMIKTYYEEKFTAAGHKISYVKFTLDAIR